MLRRGEVGLAAVLAASCTTGNPVFMVDSETEGSVTAATAASTTSMSGASDVTASTGMTGMTGLSGMSGMTGGVDSTDTVGSTVDATSSPGTTTDADSTASGSTGPALLCGNGNLDVGETCDDGNLKGGDNCEANCRALFDEPSFFDFGPGFYWDLEAGDFNNDGHIDLAAARHEGPAGALVLLNTGDGAFEPSGLFPLPGVPYMLHAVPLAGDNGDDLVVGAFEGQDVFVKHQVGGGDYDGGLEYVHVMAGFSAAVRPAHVDGDGRIDMVIPAPLGDAVAVARGKEDGFFAPPLYYQVGGPITYFAVGPLGDGPGLDIVGVYNDNVNSFFTIAYDFYPGPPTTTIKYEEATGRFSAVAVADLGAVDGTPELVFADAELKRVRVFEQDPGGQPVELVTIDLGTAPNEIAAVALRGEGSPDLITRNGLGGSISVIATFEGFTVADPIKSLGGLPLVGMAIADFDGDKYPDIAVIAPSGQVAVHINLTGE